MCRRTTYKYLCGCTDPDHFKYCNGKEYVFAPGTPPCGKKKYEEKVKNFNSLCRHHRIEIQDKRCRYWYGWKTIYGSKA
jgi:hypothetical protein